MTYEIHLNGCDRLIEFIKDVEEAEWSQLADSDEEDYYVYFEGEKVKLSSYTYKELKSGIFILDPEYIHRVFIISHCPDGKIMFASFYRNYRNIDRRRIAILLPDYIEEELIATLQGKW